MGSKKRKNKGQGDLEALKSRVEVIISGIFDSHHLRPREAGGLKGNNLLRLNILRHRIWHLLFGNLTLDEVIRLLLRVRRVKKYSDQNNHGKDRRK